ncbi:coagulation factor XIII A chain-like [Anoplopoma fimbria]|uniref:coagulation factor XIII A chain-like n=1 Tax=Anoplopoma fimbria TaxID=229290 RepID=UPI0023EB9AD6|nr:coagulation factor XIII A chain-like [Anoplopoma fimbria]
MLKSISSSSDLIIRLDRPTSFISLSVTSVKPLTFSTIMSHPDMYKGRYSRPLPTTNLVSDEDDFPEFEAFDDDPTPRGPQDGSLWVENVNMCQQVNQPKHNTTSYNTTNLVVRRGQEFLMLVTFNRPLMKDDYFQVEFLIGTNPTPNKGSLVAVTFGPNPGGLWSGRILDNDSQAVMLGITPTANAIVGKFRTYLACKVNGGLQRTRRNTSTDLYLLFNAWCPEDAVFLPNEAERREYVLNDHGVIYQGSVGSVSQRNWIYGQFEKDILDACIYILDVSLMPIYDRGNTIKVIRKGSAMINSHDDNGVLVGNWSDDFSMGKSPSSWISSCGILLQYSSTRVPVCYAQCWVFAGVFNTFLRALGIPTRVITTFNSAHDNNGNLKIDLIFKSDGSPDDNSTSDSIWNFHCWNEAWLTRPDLPPGLGGWQVVDATPQENSDGCFRCGPASVAAIKEGLLCHPYDSGFVFAEVNSDMVCYKKDRYGTLTPYRVETALIGQHICTKSVGSDYANDITHTYKYPEGSLKDKETMSRAEQYNCQRDHSELPETLLSSSITAQPVQLGQDVNLQVHFNNQGELQETIRVHLSGCVVFYTGVSANHFKDHDFIVTVPANQTVSEPFTVTAQEYMPHLRSQVSLYFVVTGQAEDQSVTCFKLVDLQLPRLNVTVEGNPWVEHQMFVTVFFTNPFTFTLENVQLTLGGAGLMNERTRKYRFIEPQASISCKEPFSPRLQGNHCMVAMMDCTNLRQVTGSIYVNISA